MFLSRLTTKQIIRHTAAILIVTMIFIGMVPKIDAAFIPSGSQDIKSEDLVTIQKALEIKQVRSRLEALGYTPEEINTRLSQLSAEEIQSLATRIDSLTTGGDGLGILISILVIVLLVVVILKIMDKEIIIR